MSALQTGGGGAHRGQESHPHLTLQTNTGEHITVPLDVHQGSRQADEKRHRNAGASARFRARKKERDKDMRDTLNRLESESRDVARHNQELQVEVDFYRSERNRLRDIVLRTPEIREHAERAPPSPRSARPAAPLSRPGAFGAAFAAGSSSPSTSPTGPPQHPPPFAGGELDRPARRRRTEDPSTDLGNAPYPMRPAQPPSTLPPIVTQGFGAPITTAPPSSRLPPLRFEQAGPGSSPTTAHTPGGFGHQAPPAPTPLQTQFTPYTRPPHEMGWATGQRDPREEHQQQQQASQHQQQQHPHQHPSQHQQQQQQQQQKNRRQPSGPSGR
ncbi:unnamed protein product [Discula destructiva]